MAGDDTIGAGQTVGLQTTAKRFRPAGRGTLGEEVGKGGRCEAGAGAAAEPDIGAEMNLGKVPRRIGIRPVDPGALYNLGNVLGFVVGLAVALGMSASDDVNTTHWDRAMAHVMGSPAAVALSTATAVFFWGGILYGRAWSNGSLTDPKLNRWGDVLSGVGAAILGIGLIMLGNPWLAASAGAMHALGKFGSALASTEPSQQALISERTGAFFKDLVLMSRVPAILAAAVALWEELTIPQSTQGLLLALTFVACCIIWATADWMLLSPRGWIRTTAARFLSNESPL